MQHFQVSSSQKNFLSEIDQEVISQYLTIEFLKANDKEWFEKYKDLPKNRVKEAAKVK